MWALTKNGHAFRFTFSRSLAEHIRQRGPEGLHIERVNFRLGRPLAHHESSRSKLYAIVSARPNTSGQEVVLRITMFPEIAALLTPDHWREIRECWLT